MIRVRKLIQDCLRSESDEGKVQLDKQLIFEEIRHEKLKEIAGFLEENNHLNAYLIKLFLEKNKEE